VIIHLQTLPNSVMVCKYKLASQFVPYVPIVNLKTISLYIYFALSTTNWYLLQEINPMGKQEKIT